jgi:NADH-quinone oxidoreductase subunit A
VLTGYGPALVFLAIGLIVAAAFGTAGSLLGPRRAAASKESQLTPYECGLPSEVSRSFRFGISFYLIAMLFLLFDIEVIFLYPIAVELRAFGTFAMVETAIVIALLVVGFGYVRRRGALEWK